MNWVFLLFFVGYMGYDSVGGQRVAPGVPPQHYQPQVPQHQAYQQQHHQAQPPQQQQYQQQQQQYQQPPPAQQIPQQQQHVLAQNPQPVHDHGHAHGHGQPQLLNAANIAQEKEHIAEHMEVPIDISKMTDQELQFHYFKMHDADNNNKLDGCELIKSLIHWHEQGNKDNQAPNAGEKIFNDEELVTLIDPILNVDDTNLDGFIDYPEFIRAQMNAAASTTARPS